MAEELERPRVGLVPKLLVACLALYGLVMLVSWVTSRLFGLLRLGLLVAVVVLVVMWIAGRVGGRDERGADA
jgi:hypothetical protein